MLKHSKFHGFAKFKLVVILAFMSSVAPLSTDMYLPALSHVEESFKTNTFLTQLSLASFFIAFAFGQLIYGPLSDIFGRKKPILIGVFIFIMSSLGCVVIDDINSFIILRFFEALGGCAGVVIARAIVNDLFEIKDAAAIFALIMVVRSLAPMLSPTFGGILLQYFSWQSIFTTLFLLGILLFIMVLFGFKESAPHLKERKFSHKEAMQGYKAVLKDKPFLVYTFVAALALASMFAYLTGSNFVFTKFFNLGEQAYAILFGVNSLGFIIFANVNAKWVQSYDPEKILALSLLVMLISLLIVLLTSFIYPNFWLFEIALFIGISMLGFIAPNTTTLAMARFKEHSGTASAILGMVEFALAGFISFIVGATNANTPLVLALVMSACLILANGLYFASRKHLNDKIY
ncbi:MULTISPECIES: multidrug effflux MFS transporter [unclassified Campylobacter]|uniref:multidrug effflux MFS transporter n=1 Tax=unclassified Campylobacter TaxID=2593542 RepID=UPI0012381F55|nr:MULTISPECIES: multidrug effflux MFS transporter [unclassified Campylobacter]KAA6224859.1 multidrug effflux MFS transporter [Campylobacter sp. LR286c]KAA6233487.1 multidrug effflux MFS transporter [Campylobacter sp. LR291e]